MEQPLDTVLIAGGCTSVHSYNSNKQAIIVNRRCAKIRI